MQIYAAAFISDLTDQLKPAFSFFLLGFFPYDAEDSYLV